MKKLLVFLKWALIVSAGLSVLVIVLAFAFGHKEPTTASNFGISPTEDPTTQPSIPAQSTPSPSSTNPLGVGSMVFLINSGDTSTSSIVFLAPINDGERVVKELGELQHVPSTGNWYNDNMYALGLLNELVNKGYFAVNSGSRGVITEKHDNLSRVRIIEGKASVDQDKIGRAGWVPNSFLSPAK